jgi:AcrR family transcriptional regulator
VWVYARTCTIVKVKAVTRARNPRGEGERLRAELLEATVDLIAETGSIDDVSLRAAAKRAGVSPTAVYQHFEDRDALVEAAVVSCWHDFRTAFLQALEQPDPFSRLRAGGALYVQFALEHPRQYAVMITETDRLPGATPIGLETFEGLVVMVKEILDANGDDRDPTFVAILGLTPAG